MITDGLDKLEEELIGAFVGLFAWFNVSDDLAGYRLREGEWSIGEILEHVSLTNHFLLILIRKGTEKAVQKAKTANFVEETIGYEINWDALRRIGEHGSFDWKRPAHMEPTGATSMSEVKARLEGQLGQCLGYLHQMPNGEGVLYKTTMTVDNLGKIDVYHYLYFLAQHIRRHIRQMQKIASEFADVGKQKWQT